MIPLVIDNYFTSQQEESIKSLLYEIPWMYVKRTTAPGFTVDGSYGELEILTHVFIRDGVFISDDAYKVFHLVNAFCDILKLQFKKIVRVNAHMWFSNKDITTGPPHIDDIARLDYKNKKYITLLYYVHDVDGDTLLYNKYGIDDTPLPRDAKVEHRISPKQGRIAIFDSNQYHSNGIPSYGCRKVINCVFEV